MVVPSPVPVSVEESASSQALVWITSVTGVAAGVFTLSLVWVGKSRDIGCHCLPAGTEGVECCCAGCCQGVLVGLLGHLDGFELLRCVFPGVVDDSITPGIWIQRGV